LKNLLTPLFPVKTIKKEDRSISIDLDISIPPLQSLTIMKDLNAPQIHQGWIETLAEDTILIYTDGSKQASGSTGCGAALYRKEGPALRHVALHKCCLGQTATVLDAELHASQEGLRALDQLLRPGVDKHAYLCIDNQAAIATLANNQFNHQYARHPLLLFSRFQARGLSIHSVWTPAHCGIIGNEMADSLAKKAVNSRKIALTRPLQKLGFWRKPVTISPPPGNGNYQRARQGLGCPHTLKLYPSVTQEPCLGLGRAAHPPTHFIPEHQRTSAPAEKLISPVITCYLNAQS
jgi:ribonuclease HI